jgi:hypothetical protein
MQDILKSAILNSYPNAKEIVSIQSYRPNYLEYPARVTIRTTDGNLAACALKVSQQADILSLEGKVLEALINLGLSVPKVFAKPSTIQHKSGSHTFLLISELSGQSLPWINYLI